MIEIFNKLKTVYDIDSDNILAESHPDYFNHKIGVDLSLQPIILINAISNQNYNVPPRKLELIDISFNQLCKVNVLNSVPIESRYTILKLKSDQPDLQQYFLNICALFLSILGNNPEVKEVHKEILKVIDMFSNFSSPPKKSVQGLFAELIIIDSSSNCDLLIEAWHPIKFDLDDFNDGICNIEVKSTQGSNRTHLFSHEQLINKHDLSYIASVLIKYSGKGMNILELISRIEKRLIELKNRVKLNQIFLSVVGENYNILSEIVFDYQYSLESIKYFKTNEIDHIDSSVISSKISNLKYTVDLSSNKGYIFKEKKSICQFLNCS